MAAQATLPRRPRTRCARTLPRLADDIVAAIAREVPDYARPMEGRFGETVRFGVQVALNRFVDVLAGERAARSPAPRDTYARLGAGEYRAGPLAGRAARRLPRRRAGSRGGASSTAGTRAGFPPDALYDLGEAIFAYIDEISAESAAGFAEAQSEAAGESQRRRQGLLRLLVQEPPAPVEAVRTAAQAAGWALPRLRRRGRRGRGRPARGPRRRARRGGPGRGGRRRDRRAARAPDRPGRGRRRGRRARGRDAARPRGPRPAQRARGRARRRARRARPGGAVAGGGASLRRAEAAFRLAAQGRLDAPGRALPERPGRGLDAGQSRSRLVVADEHLPGAAARGRAGARRRPRAHAAGAAGRARRRGRANGSWSTLRAWLDRPGQVQAVAAALDVHPQTVRYRLKQLRELFGERLEDPEARFELSLALRAADGPALLMTAMRLLVTGAAGMLGTDVVAAAAAGHDVVAFARADLDITDADAVRAAVRDTRPDAVINCAAWTDVDGAETAEAAGDADQRRRRGPPGRGRRRGRRAHRPRLDRLRLRRRRDVAVPRGRADRARSAPTGAPSSRASSRSPAAAPSSHAIVRTAWVFGPHGKNFVDTMLRLGAERDELTVVDDQLGCPTYTGHLAPALVAIAERAPHGVLHVAGGGSCTWWDLAVRDVRARRPARHRPPRHDRRASARPRRAPPTLSSAPPAPTRRSCRRGRTASPPI